MSYKELPALPPWAPMADWGDVIVKEVEGAPLAWSGEVLPPPAIGEEIYIAMNKLGFGRVVGYAAVDGYLGVRVNLREPPAWYVKQNGPGAIGLAYGAELRKDKAP